MGQVHLNIQWVRWMSSTLKEYVEYIQNKWAYIHYATWNADETEHLVKPVSFPYQIFWVPCSHYKNTKIGLDMHFH